MRIVLVHGQNRKGSSYHMKRMLAKQFPSEDISKFSLPIDLNHFCRRCYACVSVPFIKKRRSLDAVDEAELLIFTAPTSAIVSLPLPL